MTSGMQDAVAAEAELDNISTAGWRAFAPPRGRLELAAAEHVRSVVRVRFLGWWGQAGGKRWLLG